MRLRPVERCVLPDFLYCGSKVNLADPNTGDTALHISLRNLSHDTSLAILLLQEGADPNLRNFEGDSASSTLNSIALSEVGFGAVEVSFRWLPYLHIPVSTRLGVR